MKIPFLRSFGNGPDSSSAGDDFAIGAPIGDQLAGQFGGWAQHLETLGEQLLLLNGSTEDEFLAIGARLHDFYSRAADIERMTQAIAGQVMGEEIKGEMASLGTILERIGGYLAHAEEEVEQSTTTLETIRDLIVHLNDPLDGFKKIIKNLHMLSTAVKIESARLGEGAAGFNTLAEDVERLSVSIRDRSASILAERDALGGMIEGTLGRVAQVETEQRKNIRPILDKTGDSLSTLAVVHERCSAAAASVSALSAEISGNIGEVVTSLQFHDITRQQIEHVKEAFDDIRCQLEAPVTDSRAVAGECADICELQQAQLQHAAAELVTAVERVVGGLQDIARKEAHMADESRGMAGIADQTGHSLFAEMENDMGMVAAALAESAEANRNLTVAMEAVVASVSDIAKFVNDIEEIGSEIELIALNSQVKAANTGDGGAALGVLAEAIQNLSGDARTRTGAVSEMLRKVTEVTESLIRENRLEVRTMTDEVESLVSELKLLLGSVRRINEELLTFLGEMDGAVQLLSVDIDAATRGVSVHHSVQQVLSEAIGELDDLVRQVRQFVPLASGAGREARLRELAERYTMHSERKVHAAVTGGGASSGGAAFPATAAAYAGEQELGDNVDLF
ncbi:chemotaxis protein [Geotalea uraniireducens]|uniref:Chemotaxis protein n=1 Tax=Geotalea uraniireducens TaxID=351604 RepID=A0ABM8EJ47_9BACT|nr:methyl-accepting chemotaxis protein [Geotalea uraniireducens]BDV42395.1 chemotaxis protein [Geotalea uraniireducens]